MTTEYMGEYSAPKDPNPDIEAHEDALDREDDSGPALQEQTMDLFADIIAYENGEMDEDQILDLFTKLVATGLVYQLQGHYGRTAAALGLI